MSNEVIIKDAVKRYGDFIALNGVSLDIREGEFFTLLGPSGCGKTTLLRMIAGFNSIEGGDFYFGEKRINDVAAHKRDIGMVFQNYAIFPHLTVRENVAYGLKARKTPKAEMDKRVDEALELVQISHLAERKPNELSGGQQQRVALARAFVIEPSVLLMDEPLSNLDAKLRVQMRTVIKKLQRRLGITTIYVTHDQEEALTLSDTIVVLDDGNIQQIGTPTDIYNEPQNSFVADFIGESNIIDGVMRDDGVVEIFNRKFACLDKGFSVYIPSYETEQIKAISLIAEGIAIHPSMMYLILNYTATIEAFMALKLTYTTLPDGELTLLIHGHAGDERIRIAVKEGKHTVESISEETPVDLELGHLEATELLFGCISATRETASPLIRAWFPLPLWMYRADEV